MHERLISILSILIVNAGTGLLYWAIRRWYAPIRFGYIGLLFIFLPIGFDALDFNDEKIFGGTSNISLGIYILCAVIGLFILIADVAAKLRNDKLQIPSNNP